MTKAERDALRDLEAKATPGEWSAEQDFFDCADGIEAHVVSPRAEACFRSFPIRDAYLTTRDCDEINQKCDAYMARRTAR